MTMQPFKTTANFDIYYEDSLGQSQRRAQAIYNNVEADFDTLLDWFQVPREAFGTSNRIQVKVQTDSLAHNYGYHSGDGTAMLITLDSLEGAPANALGDDAAMALFVAEMSEILMSYRAQKKGGTWNESDSMGEGLSVFCTGMMHPQGYYGVTGLGPRINTWFTASDRNQSNRDWVDRVNATDTDAYSYGGSLVYLYYLYSQLNYSIRDIILSGGKNLAETYQNLTGKTDALQPFNDLLDKYYPVDKISNLPTDNPFPLLPANERQIQLTFTQVLNGKRTRTLEEGNVVISPYIGCPAESYHYWVENSPQKDQCVATVTGFGEPKYSWKVNGQLIDAPRVITTTTTVLLDNPADPNKPTSTTQTVDILCRPGASTWTAQARQGELDLIPYTTPGHIMVNVECDVTEQYTGDTGTTATSKTTLIDQQTLLYEPKYYADRDRCSQAFWNRVRQIAEKYAKSAHLFIWQTLPDPGPDMTIALQMIEDLRTALAEVEQVNPREGRLLRSMVATMLHTSPAILGGTARVTDGAVEERRVESVLEQTNSTLST